MSVIHFVCTGTCGGVSERVGNCQAESCPKHGQPLEVCNCVDDKHAEVKDKKPSSGSEPASA